MWDNPEATRREKTFLPVLARAGKYKAGVKGEDFSSKKKKKRTNGIGTKEEIVNGVKN